MMIAIFLTLAFHELGHALSGANDNKVIESIGLAVQLFVPTAYVRFREHHYDLTPWRQLKVYCAGAWHNFVLYLLAYLVIANSSMLFRPAFVRHEDGQVVASIRFHSDYSPLKAGDTVLGLNQHTIHTLQDWNEAIVNVFSTSNNESSAPSVCTPRDWIYSGQMKDIPDCCEETYDGAIPCWREAKRDGKLFCKPAKEVWASDVTYCNDTPGNDPTCTQGDMVCARPAVQQKYAQYGLTLLQLRVLRDGHHMLLHTRQHPLELAQQVNFEYYHPRWKWMPEFTKRWADHALILSELLVSFNLITPIVSLLPIMAFDGEYVLYALTMWIAPEMDEDLRESGIAWVRNAITAVGIIIGLLSLYKALL